MTTFDTTFREMIIQHLVDRYSRRVVGVDDAKITWDVVTTKPLTKAEQGAGNSIGIYDTSEKVFKEVGYDQRFLNVVIEFHCTVSIGDTAPGVLRQAMGEVQRVAGLDIYCTQPNGYKLTLNLEEQGNEMDVGGSSPNISAGVVIYLIKYRTKSNDPFSR